MQLVSAGAIVTRSSSRASGTVHAGKICNPLVRRLNRRLRFWLIVCPWLLLLGVSVPARCIDRDRRLDQLIHTAWLAKDGAPGSINVLAQTTDGYLWIGTENGLFRFDGVRFERYETHVGPPLSSDSIRSLLALPDGGLWIGSNTGQVSFLKDGKLTNYGEITGSLHNPVWSIVKDRQGTIWVAARRGGLLRLEGTHWTKVGAEQNFAGDALSLFLDHKGTLWAGTNDTVMFLPAGERRFHMAADHLIFVTSIKESPDGTMWMADFGRAVKTIAAPSDSRTAQSAIAVASLAILFDGQGSLWVTSKGDGLRRIPYPERLNGSRIGQFSGAAEIFTQKQGLSFDAMSCIFEDREGNIWAGTSAGLDRFRQSNIVPVTFPAGTEIFALEAMERGTIQVAASNRPLMSIEDGRLKVVPGHLDAMEGVRIPGGTVVTQHYLSNPEEGRFAGTTQFSGSFEHPRRIEKSQVYNFPQSFYPGTNRFLDPSFKRTERPQSLVKDRSGRWWFSISGEGVFRSTDKSYTSLEILGGPRGSASSSFMDPSGHIWFGFHNSVAMLDGEKVWTFSARDGIAVGDVVAIHGNGPDIWIAGDHDLAFFDGVRFHQAKTEPNNALSGIRSLVVAADESLWISADSGLCLVPGSEIRAAYKDHEHRLQIRRFGLQDGISSEMQGRTLQSSALGTDGRVYFATLDGVVWADPKRILHNDVPPPVLVHSLAENGTTRYFPGPITLPPRTTNVAIHYTALSLSIPERVRFRYKLEGVDRDWQDVDTRRDAYYSNLGPGSYVFRVIACNEDGLWNEAGAIERFVIEPAFYQTWWFQLVYVSLGIGLLRAFYLYRLNRATAKIHERLSARMEERERIARELHDTFLQGFQGLMLRFQAVMKTLPADAPARTMMEQVLDRADEVLLEGRQSVRDLREEGTSETELSEALRHCGEELAQNHNSQFSLTIVGEPKPVAPVVFNESYRIAREALINAFQHAQARKIEVEVTYLESGISLRVRDDGMGIDPTTLSKGRAGHWGLSGMRERAQKIAAKVDIWSQVGAGTEIELTIKSKVAYPQKMERSRWQRIKAALTRNQDDQA
jgi:signal transduction histidine kinase/ligand-binding sensor domain-containing protein